MGSNAKLTQLALPLDQPKPPQKAWVVYTEVLPDGHIKKTAKKTASRDK